MKRWLIIALVLSVAINLALVGFVAGRWSGPTLFPSPDPTLGFPRMLRSLPDERRSELRPLVREHFGAVRPHLGKMRTNHRALGQAIVAEPFDEDALRGVLNDMRQGLAASQTASHATFVAFVGALTREERQQLARNLHRGRGDRHRNKDRFERPRAPEASEITPGEHR